MGRSHLTSKVEERSIIDMKFFHILFSVGLVHSGIVRREADAGTYGSSSAPICKSVPEKTCTPRNVEKPKKVCHDEYDEIVDTTIIEKCEETITTKCEQVSTQARHSSGVVGHDSKVVATGVAASPERVVSYGGISSGYGSSYGSYGSSAYGKREAEADAKPKAEAEGANYGYTSGIQKSAPICKSVPQKTATTFPLTNPGKSRMLFVRLLLISKSLRIAKRLSPPIVNKHHKRFLTILLLLDMIQELAPLLLWTAMQLVIVMV